MRPHRLILALTAGLLLPPAVRSTAAQSAGTSRPAQAPGRQALVESALSAAPPAVAAHAAVMDMQQHVLRPGSNGFTCFPDDPAVPNNAPMCLDATWAEVIDAWMHRRAPAITGMGISYMLQGDLPVSNTDPFATGPTADNQWIQVGRPHIMIVLPDPALLDGVSTDPDNGGPWVMWKGTPYAHVMIPTIPRGSN